MKVLNIMLSRDLGGIQQAFLDYGNALKLQGIDVVNVTSIFAKINSYVPKTIKLPNLGPWDIISSLYLKLIISFTKPDIIIAHGNRAINFSRLFFLGKLVGVAHNYSLKGLKKCDYIIVLTEHMRNYLLEHNFNPENIATIPNMRDIEQHFIPPAYRDPIVIGTIARFVKKKGVDIFLGALANLKKQKYKFRALIGGSGEEEHKLLILAKNLGIDEDVSFTGWVENKKQFFENIDIFCLPSTHEPFGIIILEAMGYSKPIVAAASEGPSEILRNKVDGLLCRVDSSDDLTNKLAELMDNPGTACEYAASSYLRVKENYAIKIIALKLSDFLNSIITK